MLPTALLKTAYPEGPKQFLKQAQGTKDHSGGDADVIVFCLHCMMVENGFVPLPSFDRDLDPSQEAHTRTTLLASSKRSTTYSLPKDWNDLEDEWVIVYARKSSPSWFRLHCALQRATGRLFVHACETETLQSAPKPSNIQVLGLQLANYHVERQQSKESNSWDDYVTNERTLREMFKEFVLEPLWNSANVTSHSKESADPSQSNASPWYSKSLGLANRDSYAMAVTLGIIVISCGCVYALSSYRNRRWPTVSD
jgi:hypothetical protein